MAIGDTIRPELGRTDFTPFMQGSMAGSAALGQGISNLGAGIGKFLGDKAEAKKAESKGKAAIKAFMTLNPEYEQAGNIFLQKIDQEDSLSKRAAMASMGEAFAKMGGEKADRDMMKQSIFFDQGMQKANLARLLNQDITQREQFDRTSQSREEAERRAFRGEEMDRGLREREVKVKEKLADASVTPRLPVQFNDLGVRTDPETGKVEYASPALAKMDDANINLYSGQAEVAKDADWEIKRLKAFKEQVKTNGTGFMRWANTWGGNITAGTYEEGFMMLKKEMAAKLAKLNNGSRVTDADVKNAEQSLFQLSASKESNLAKIDELIDKMEFAKKEAQSKEKYLLENGTLIGYGRDGQKLDTNNLDLSEEDQALQGLMQGANPLLPPKPPR